MCTGGPSCDAGTALPHWPPSVSPDNDGVEEVEKNLMTQKCCVDGKSLGLRERLRSPYHYYARPASITANGAERASALGPFYVCRDLKSDGDVWPPETEEVLCRCGRWAREPLKMYGRRRDEVAPGDGRVVEWPNDLEFSTARRFASARTADDYARRLNHRVPQNWEVIVAVSALLGTASAPLFESAIRWVMGSLT